MVQNKRSRLILDATYVAYLGTERINGTVRVLFKTRLIFSRINGAIMSMYWTIPSRETCDAVDVEVEQKDKETL